MLVISDNTSFIDSIDGAIQSIEGLKLVSLPTIDSAHSNPSWDRVALVLIQIQRIDQDDKVIQFLRTIAGHRRPVATIVVADHFNSEKELNFLRMGVADYLGRPLNLARITHLAEILTIRTRDSLRPRSSGMDRPSEPASPAPVLVEKGEAGNLLMDQVDRVASLSATTLLSGETGTGKTRLARQIHDLSNRRAEPFVVINCGSLTASQLEVEMFGHARGSLELPRKDRMGKLIEAGLGTVFLDEIDALPLSIQSRLLRVVEDRVIESMGEPGGTPFRARLIAATSRNLEQEIEEGQFRSDLYYRINVIGLQLPPLRERQSLIPSLISTFLAQAVGPDGDGRKSISEPALQVLERYNWPGNIRELKNTIDRAVALASGPVIEPDDLPEAVSRREMSTVRRSAFAPVDLSVPSGTNSTLAEIKRDAELARITEALEKHSNNRLRAACELGISRMTLYKKLYKYGLINQGHEAERRSGN